MLSLLKVILWSVRSLALSRQALVLDNLALCQQLAVATRSGQIRLRRMVGWRDLPRLNPAVAMAEAA